MSDFRNNFERVAQVGFLTIASFALNGCGDLPGAKERLSGHKAEATSTDQKTVKGRIVLAGDRMEAFKDNAFDFFSKHSGAELNLSTYVDGGSRRAALIDSLIRTNWTSGVHASAADQMARFVFAKFPSLSSSEIAQIYWANASDVLQRREGDLKAVGGRTEGFFNLLSMWAASTGDNKKYFAFFSHRRDLNSNPYGVITNGETNPSFSRVDELYGAYCDDDITCAGFVPRGGNWASVSGKMELLHSAFIGEKDGKLVIKMQPSRSEITALAIEGKRQEAERSRLVAEEADRARRVNAGNRLPDQPRAATPVQPQYQQDSNAARHQKKNCWDAASQSWIPGCR